MEAQIYPTGAFKLSPETRKWKPNAAPRDVLPVARDTEMKERLVEFTQLLGLP